MSVKKFMQQVHRESALSQTAGVRVTATPATPTPKVTKEEEPKTQEREVEGRPRVVQASVETARREVAVTTEVSTPIQQIARPDIALERYGVNPWKSNFNIYNKDIVNFVRNFSSDNQLNGGSAITKSQMIEVILDVVFYDIGLEPEGFDSADELRKHLQEKLR